MKTRLIFFVLALLLLPMAGYGLSEGGDWFNEISSGIFAGYATHGVVGSSRFTAALFTGVVLLGFIFLVNHITRLRTGHSPLSVPGKYFLAMGAASAVLGWLLVYLNHFVATWRPAADTALWSLLLHTVIFSLLAPAVLSLRALLGSFTGLLKLLARGKNFPAPGNETSGDETRVYILISFAVFGLLGGAAWPAQLFWLFWLAPLLLLVALQLLWHEDHVFSGNVSRMICVALAGIITCNFALISYQTSGGNLQLNLPHPLFAQLGFAVFGLLCQQLGDVIAEHWRGIQRDKSATRKSFPIPVVAKKD